MSKEGFVKFLDYNPFPPQPSFNTTWDDEGVLTVTDWGAEIKNNSAMQDLEDKVKRLEARVAELEAENKDPNTAKLLMRRVFGQDGDW
jgi:hypothetical protein